MQKRLISLFAVLGVAALIWWAKPLYLRAGSDEAPVDKPLHVQITPVKSQVVPIWLDTVAPLQAKQHIQLTSQVQGQVDQILVKEGQFVEQGTPLLRLRPDFTIKSPISGYLSDWQMTVGEYLNVGSPVVDIINKSQVIVNYSVPESYAGQVKMGQRVFLTFRAFKDQTFEGDVTFISPEVREADHSIHIKALVPNPDHQLLPGMFAHVKHLLDEKKDALVVPESAVLRKISGYEVFVVDGDKAKRQPIQIGTRFDGKIHVVEGLKKSDQVVISIPPTLFDGQAILTTLFAGDW